MSQKRTYKVVWLTDEATKDGGDGGGDDDGGGEHGHFGAADSLDEDVCERWSRAGRSVTRIR